MASWDGNAARAMVAAGSSSDNELRRLTGLTRTGGRSLWRPSAILFQERGPREQTTSTVIATACLLALIPLTTAATVNLESPPADRSIHIDANPRDWDGLPMVYLENSLRSLSITHDDDNIYLMWFNRRA